jgi:hypothetical protein
MLVSAALSVFYPPSSSGVTSCSYGKMPTTTGPKCDDMHALLINEFDSRIKENIFKSDATILFDIFLDRAQNYESNRTSFMIFRALNREIQIFKC